MFDRYVKGLLEYRWLVIVLSVALTAVLGFGARNLYFEADYRVFFEKSNPHLMAFERVQASFTRADSAVFVVIPADGNVFSNESLSLVRDLTEEAWTIPHTQRVDSITNFQHTYSIGDVMTVEALVQRPGTYSDAELQRIRDIVLNEKQLVGKLVRPEAIATGINVFLYLPGESPQEVRDIAHAAKALAAKYEATYPGSKILLSGMVIGNYAMEEVIADDTSFLIPLMWVIIFASLAFLLRSITGLLVTVAVIIMSVVGALGVLGWLGYYLSGPSASIPIIIVTMAVADCVHLLVSYYHQLDKGLERQAAVRESLRINLGPVFITSVTTAIGFLSMNFSDVPPFKHLGNTVAGGVCLAFLFSVTFLPACVSLLPPRKTADERTLHKFTAMLSEFVIRYRRPLLWGSVLSAAAMAILAPMNEIDDQFVKYFSEDTAFRQASDYADENLSSLYQIEVVMKSPSEAGVTDVEFLRTIDSFSDWLLLQPEVLQVTSLADTFKRLNRSMHGDDDVWYQLPENDELAAQYLLLYEMSLPFGLDTANLITFDRNETRVSVTLESMTSKKMVNLDERIKAWMAEKAPSVEYYTSGTTLMFSYIGITNAHSMIKGTLFALFLISLILMLMLRSLRYGLISLAPNLLPALFAFGVWALLYGKVGLSVAISIGMTLGIVVDSTVHFLAKYVRARRENHQDAEHAVRYAFSSVGIALLVTNVVLILGFVVLAQSDMKVNADMGLFTALTFLIGLILDFLFLPALLLLLDKDGRADSKRG